MVRSITILFLLLGLNTVWAADGLRAAIPVTPDTEITPGDFCSEDDKDFYEHRYKEKMPYCDRNVAQWLKNRVYKAYTIPEKCRHRYTVDHLVPLSLGGNNAQENLWPEHVLVKRTRQQLELDLYKAVERNEMSSQDAVQILLEAKLQLQLDLSHVDGCG